MPLPQIREQTLQKEINLSKQFGEITEINQPGDTERLAVAIGWTNIVGFSTV